jgi:hypothetical protein
VETGVEGQRLTAEDQLIILMQTTLCLTATRGMGASEVQNCYEVRSPCAIPSIVPYSCILR